MLNPDSRDICTDYQYRFLFSNDGDYFGDIFDVSCSLSTYLFNSSCPTEICSVWGLRGCHYYRLKARFFKCSQDIFDKRPITEAYKSFLPHLQTGSSASSHYQRKHFVKASIRISFSSLLLTATLTHEGRPNEVQSLININCSCILRVSSVLLPPVSKRI